MSVADIHDVTQSDQIAAVAAVPLEASVLVPSRGAAEAQAVGGVAAALVCTQCTMSMQSDHMPCNGSLECSLSFRGVTVLLSASRGCAGDVKPWAPTATDPFVDVMLVQLVLIKGEFSADCCMHMKTVLVHTVIGFGDSTNEELMETTALSRGYTSRRCVSIEPQSKCTCLMSQFYRGMSYSTTSGSIVREQDPITEGENISILLRRIFLRCNIVSIRYNCNCDDTTGLRLLSRSHPAEIRDCPRQIYS